MLPLRVTVILIAKVSIFIANYCCPLKSFLIDMPFFWSGQKVKG